VTNNGVSTALDGLREIVARRHCATVQWGHHIESVPVQPPLVRNLFPVLRIAARVERISGVEVVLDELP
jgi:hypothetical protein